MSAVPVRAADALVQALGGHGIDLVTCVAGESYLPLLDALYESSIDVVTCRHEGSAGFMALADSKLTGRPGVCLVNRGPGATNASIAVHSAAQDATPLLLLVGHVLHRDLGTQAFQELDIEGCFSGMAKGVWTLHHPERAYDIVDHALTVASSGTPGPTVVALPEGLLEQVTAPPHRARAHVRAPLPAAADLATVRSMLDSSQRPLLLAGRALRSTRGRMALRAAAERHALPVATSNKNQDLLDNAHPLYVGHLHHGTRQWQRELFGRSDFVVAVGTRLDAVTTGRGSFPARSSSAQALVHVHSDPLVTGHQGQCVAAIACDPVTFLEALADVPPAWKTADREQWAGQLRTAETRQARWQPEQSADGLPFGAFVAAMNEHLPPRAIVTVDAGNFTTWVHRYLRIRDGLLIGVGSSAMGFGVPAAIAAALRHPELPVVCFVGDGGALMTGTELATAVQRRARLVIVVANNGSYGTIRQHQERAYPGRSIGTALRNPDFAAMARAFGATGFEVHAGRDIEPTLDRALAVKGPAVIDVHVSAGQLSAYHTVAVAPAIPA